MLKITKVIMAIAIIIIILLVMASCKSNKVIEERNNYKAKYELLSISYIEVRNENDRLRQENLELKDELDKLKSDYIAKSMFNDFLYSKVGKQMTWIILAEYMLENQGIDFKYIPDEPLIEN